jgi:acetate kinase
MKVLVANLGSTSFKYRLFDMTDERQLARGGIERVGQAQSKAFVEIGAHRQEDTLAVPDHAVAVRRCLEQLTDPKFGCLQAASEVAAIGFKAVHPGSEVSVALVTSELLDAMEAMNEVAPAHNPPYVAAMRLLRERLPEIPLVAAFETGFHRSIPDRNRFYAVPHEWALAHHVRRYGFHGASHRYIATRSAELLGRDDLRIISCHLGGSSSLCAIRAGQSVATTMGMSPQSGLPNNNRVGDFDPFALPALMKSTGKSLAELLDLQQAAAGGNQRAQLALDVFIGAVRQYLGAYLVELGGADAIIFTGGIGENGSEVRAAICASLTELGIELDAQRNRTARGEAPIHTPCSRAQIWVVPTNEEIVVARQTRDFLQGQRPRE